MPKETQTLMIDGDTVTALYNESVGVDVREIGEIVLAKKISDVKFDVRAQRWVAIDRKTKRVIASDRSRIRCVAKEHAYYEKEIARGRIPWAHKKQKRR